MDRPLLILDLDETLVFATDDPPPPRAPDFTAGPFAVLKRPFVDDFLAQLADDFTLSVWTSSSSAYALPIVHRLVPDPAALAFVWCCNRCTRRFDPEWQEYYWAKDLRKVRRLGYALERVLIVDDSPEKVARHYGNHVRVAPFTGDPADTELRDLIPFLRGLRDAPNVRTIEKRGWRNRTKAVR
jgi:RNA polymerase II subunit A small phosphatase-like protein